MGQSLVKPQGRGGTVSHESLQVELGDQTAGESFYLVIAVVGVTHDWQDVPHGEDDGSQPGCPQSNIYLMGEKMMFKHKPSSGSLLMVGLSHCGE